MPSPSLEFLLNASKPSLQDFELLKLGEASRLMKDGAALTLRSRDALAEALLARWLIDHKEALLELGRMSALQKALDFPDVLATDALARKRTA